MASLFSSFNVLLLPLFRDLFCKVYRIHAPCLPLKEIIHWNSFTKTLKLEDQAISSERSYVASGYFYSISSPSPCASDLSASIERGRELRAKNVLFPLIRHTENTALLQEQDFVSFPCFFEAIYTVQKSIDADLRAQLGAKKFREITRLARKAEDFYTLTFFQGDSAVNTPGVLENFQKLNQLNLSKYNHPQEIYSLDILKEIFSSTFGNQFVIALRRDKETNHVVQASLSFIDQCAGEMLRLTQGIDHARVRPGHNLYTAEAYQLYCWAAELGIKHVNLGRGATETKLNLGANTFFVLNSYLKPLHNPPTAELFLLKEKALHQVSHTIATLGLNT